MGTLVGTVICLPILLHPIAPVTDQAWLLYMGSQNSWPHFEGGISARAFVWVVSRFVRAFSQDATVLNTAVRCAAALLTAAGLWIALQPAGRWRTWLWLTFAASGFLWVGISSELVAAAGVAWLYCAKDKSIGSFAAASWLLCFAKPDLLLPGLSLTIGVSALRSQYRVDAAVVACTAVLLTMPIFAMLTSEPSIDRASMSLGQHYALLKAGDTGWADWQNVMAREFGSDWTWRSVITSPAYRWFVLTSIHESALTLLRSGLLWLLPLAGLGWWHRKDHGSVVFLGLTAAVIVVLSVLHTRYLARVLILAIVGMGWMLATCSLRMQRVAAAALIGYALSRMEWLTVALTTGVLPSD